MQDDSTLMRVCFIILIENREVRAGLIHFKKILKRQKYIFDSCILCTELALKTEKIVIRLILSET